MKIKQSNDAQAGAPKFFQPAYIRLPRPGQHCPHTGLTRTGLYTLLRAGKIKSKTIRQAGCKRGIRLIDFSSLLAAINAAGDDLPEAISTTE